ncbi:hypothetical protein Taro_012338 [Colocasia esculenta]|uniref:Isocitrate lyase n=1 Tax=Colocasia esculenta TaxID=4460 RepID=A0A843UD98_COLES|nr:hypothetical protein [Colocasia esculenta]
MTDVDIWDGTSIATALEEATVADKSCAKLQRIEDEWQVAAQLKTFPDCVKDAINRLNVGEPIQLRSVPLQRAEPGGRSKAGHGGADLPRIKEGFYLFRGSVAAAVVRGWAFANHADLIWMENSSPDLAECTEFAQRVKAACLEIMMAYNLSLSFNWDASGMTDEHMRNFIPQIAWLGFCWQLITLAGFHADAIMVDTFAKDFACQGMLAYREERRNEVDTLTHQNWFGANFYDRYLKTVQGSISSTPPWAKVHTQAKHLLSLLPHHPSLSHICLLGFVVVTKEQFKETWVASGWGGREQGGSRVGDRKEGVRVL